MANKIKIELTGAQLSAIIEITNDISSMIGCGENDKIWEKQVKLIDKMLKNNGYERQYK